MFHCSEVFRASYPYNTFFHVGCCPPEGRLWPPRCSFRARRDDVGNCTVSCFNVEKLGGDGTGSTAHERIPLAGFSEPFVSVLFSCVHSFLQRGFVQ